MKTWFDWMDQYYIPHPQPVAEPNAESERILALTRQKLGINAFSSDRIPEENNVPEPGPLAKPSAPKPWAPAQPRTRSTKRLLALAAVAVLLFCLGAAGAVAAGVFPWQTIRNLYGAESQQQAERLGMPGEGLELTRTRDGITVTLEGILVDGTAAYLPAQITLSGGQYDPALRYGVWGSLHPTETGVSSGTYPLEDLDPSDSTVPLMLTADCAGLQPGDTVTLTMQRIYGNALLEDGSTEPAWSWDYELTFTFTLPEFAPTRTIAVPEGTVEPETGLSIAQVRLTPLRLEVTFGAYPQDSQMRDRLSRLPLSLTLTDGSTLSLPEGWGEDDGVRSAEGGQGSASSPTGGAYYTVGCEFGRFLDPDAVASVSVNGVEILLP